MWFSAFFLKAIVVAVFFKESMNIIIITLTNVQCPMLEYIFKVFFKPVKKTVFLYPTPFKTSFVPPSLH